MKNKLCAAGILLLTIVIAILHQNAFARFLVGFEALTGAVLYLQVRRLKKQVKINLQIGVPHYEKGEELRLMVGLENEGRLPVPEIRVELICEDCYSAGKNRCTATAMLDGYGEAELTFRFQSQFCGEVKYWIKKVTVTDYLGIFTGEVSCPKMVHTTSVIPVCEGEEPGKNVTEGTWNIRDAGTNLSGAKGEDPSEVNDIRKYQEGDTMHRIHWNMYAKTDEMLVREAGETKERMALLMLDLKRNGKEHPWTREEWDTFLQKAGLMSRHLLGNQNMHYVAWLDEETKSVCRMYVVDGESLALMLTALVRVKPYTEGEIEECYREKYGDETLKQVIRLGF